MKYNNSLLKSTKETPEEFDELLTSYFLKKKELSDRLLSFLFLKLIKNNPAHSVASHLPILIETIAKNKGIQSAFNILSCLEVALDFRKPSLGLYDHALHFIGGAQKYGCTIAHALQNDFDITVIANREITLLELQKWYNLNLSRCQIKIIKIPFFEEGRQGKILIDPSEVDLKKDNPFHIISKESGNYDIFINNSMLEMVYPLANISVFICHFPEREKSRFFHAEKYTEIIYNSLYTANWIKKKWNLTPHRHIYPPVDMEGNEKAQKKESIILSVSRFDPGGNKQQLEMIRAFKKLAERYPKRMREWKLVLVGGSIAENPYLERVKRMLPLNSQEKIELRINVRADELKGFYQKAKIFWHFCGLNQSDPAKVEHFGMNIAEAMQNSCVPVVFNGGGQTEIVEDGISGFLFSSEKDLMGKTIELINNPDLLNRLGQNSLKRGKDFHKNIFVDKVKKNFNRLLAYYRLLEENQGSNLGIRPE